MRPCLGVAAQAVVAWLCATSPALALQPLTEFQAAARTQNPLVRQAHAQASAAAFTRDAEARRLWPSLTARAGYVRNEHASEARVPDGQSGFREVTITPQDQLDAVFTVEVPLVDIAQWRRVDAAGASREAATGRATDAREGVARSVARVWHQTVAAEAVLEAAGRSLSVAEKSLARAQARFDAGAASELEQQRAVAQVERSRQAVVEAERATLLARRTLESLSGLKPTPGVVLEVANLEEPAPLRPDAAGDTAQVKAARAFAAQAALQSSAASAAKLPTLAASISERVTNATGFAGENTAYTAGVTLTWRLDAATFAQADAAAASADGQSHAAAQTAVDAQDRAYDAWLSVRAQVARVKAAMAELAATQRAAELARSRFEGGAATQLDALQADRDAFQAEVGLIQARADLAFARVDLRIALGEGEVQ